MKSMENLLYDWLKTFFFTLFQELNELIEGKDEGFVPWVMGWIHSATNFITADEN